jgi:ketosteroid isomerase-like protein
MYRTDAGIRSGVEIPRRKPRKVLTMKTSTCALLLFSVFLPGLARAQSPAQPEILPLLHEQMVAANAHDTDRFLATYLHSPELVFVVNGRVIRGFDSLREQQLQWWNHGKSDVVYTEQVPPQIQHLGNDAMVVTQQLSSRRTGPDGKPMEGTIAVSAIWRRLPDGWRVVYAHESIAR